MQPYLFLDAGWTLLFPNQRLMRQLIGQYGYEVSEERLRRLMAEFVRNFDERLRRDGQAEFNLFQWVLEGAGVQRSHIPSIAKEFQLLDAEGRLWASTYPWVHETLTHLAAQGYRMSVISNADGRVAEELASIGLAGYFEEVFDSHIVGYAKPDPRLFEHALTWLKLRPAECLFVGDVYYVDVLGANRANIAAVHLDPYGLYEGWPGHHLPNIAALPDFLATEGLDLQSDMFFPLRQDLG